MTVIYKKLGKSLHEYAWRRHRGGIRIAARTEGMMTGPVYEGKSMQGRIDLVRKGYFPAGSKVLYAHLGGVPAINAQLHLSQRLTETHERCIRPKGGMATVDAPA